MGEPQRDADPAIDVSDLSLGYPSHGGGRAFNAVEGLSFRVRRGDVLALLGESGSGKSTVTRFLSGRGNEPSDKSAHIKVNGGDATVLGMSMRRLRRKSQRALTIGVGLLTQDAGATLPAELNVGDVLLAPIAERTKRFDPAPYGETIAEMMDIVGLPLAILQEFPYALSKGQRQRVAVMRSLMLSPSVYFSDEPTLGVDANNRPRIIELLRWYRARTGATLVLVSHDIGVLEALGQHVLVMQQGRAVGEGQIDEIFRHTEHAYVRQLALALRASAYDEVAEA